jgi:NTP pyrophosphatase (non-canonical NTP hydrolase)
VEGISGGDKVTEHFNGLTEAEAERLALLAEECAEVIQAVTKIQRHGYESRNPDLPMSPSNRANLAKELGHVMHALGRMVDEDDLTSEAVNLSKHEKFHKIAKYLHHQFWRRGDGNDS